MRYYSDNLKKFFDTSEECEKAEEEFSRKHAEEVARKEAEAEARKAAAHLVEEKKDVYLAARKDYLDELEKFCSKYKTYHTSVKPGDFSVFDDFFNWF